MLIVGDGLAGTLVAWELKEQGVDFEVWAMVPQRPLTWLRACSIRCHFVGFFPFGMPKII